MRTLTAAVLTGSLALAAAGCGGGGGANDNGVSGAGQASQTQQQLCASLTKVSDALKQLQSLDPATATSAEIKADAANLRTAAKSATAAAAAESKTSVASIEADAATLQAAVKAVPAGTSPKNELQQVKPQLDTTAKLIQSTINGLACSST